jgi:hypothetical protein
LPGNPWPEGHRVAWNKLTDQPWTIMSIGLGSRVLINRLGAISILSFLKIRGLRAAAPCEASVRERAREPMKASGQRA